MNGYECMECGEVERDGIGESDVECGRCESYNTVARRLTDCDDKGCDEMTHDWGASWHVDES